MPQMSAIFPVKTSTVPCPRQERTFSGFQGKVTISSLSPGVCLQGYGRTG